MCFRKIDQDIHDQLSGISITQIFEDARQGKLELDMSGIFKALISYFCRSFLPIPHFWAN